MSEKTVEIAVTDDHELFRKGLIALIDALDGRFKVVIEATNGNDLITQLQAAPSIPDLIILDMNMPGKSGYETVVWLNQHYPNIKVLIVSMVEREESVIQMLKLGVRGYLSKDIAPEHLEEAILAVTEKGFYYTDFITGKLLLELQKDINSINTPVFLSEKEKEILQLMCTELTHKEIANKLGVSVKTVDNYRDVLCKKLNAVSRIGLVTYAIRNKIVEA
ncbi:MAG: response regulator [Chitinophagaceae bacterium]